MDNEYHTVRGYALLQQNSRLLTPAMEDYLEMVYRNTRESGYLRIIELADQLNVKASSATKMVQKLGELGLINYQKYGVIELTDAGRDLGAHLLRRHTVIQDFLCTIGIDKDLLVETELIEHNVSTGTLKHLEMLNLFFESNPDLLRQFRNFTSQKLDNTNPL